MGRNRRMPGLVKRSSGWYVDKKVDGRRIYESTGSGDRAEAERYLVHRLEQIRQATVYGVRPKRIFREAALKFVRENGQKASIKDDVGAIKQLAPYIGALSLEAVHMGSLQAFIQARKDQGVKSRTINYALQLVRHILNLAAGEWLDEHGLTWLVTAPKIKLLPELDKRKPYPLSWDEQERLFKELPPHLLNMAIFAVNTGCRDREICNLRWEWEVGVPDLNCTAFIIPGVRVKNREDRLVVINNTAKTVIDKLREKSSEYVFTFKGKPVQKMLRSAWRKARERAGLPQVRVHDLKHTFGRRLRAAGVSFEDRQDLLGHKSGRITTHYSSAELNNLLQAANKVCGGTSSPALTLLKHRYIGIAANADAEVCNPVNGIVYEESRKSHASSFV